MIVWHLPGPWVRSLVPQCQLVIPFFFLKGFLLLIVCVYMWVQKRTLGCLELKIQTVVRPWYRCWDLNSGPLFLQYLQYLILTTETLLQALVSPPYPGMVALACNPKTQQVEKEELPQLWGQLGYKQDCLKQPNQTKPNQTKLHNKLIVGLGRPWRPEFGPRNLGGWGGERTQWHICNSSTLM